MTSSAVSGDDERVLATLRELYQAGRTAFRAQVVEGERVRGSALNARQLGAHALSFLAIEVEASAELLRWAARVDRSFEWTIARAYLGELCRSLRGGLTLSQTEHIGLDELGLDEATLDAFAGDRLLRRYAREHASGDALLAIAKTARESGTGDFGLAETEDEIRRQFARFSDTEVVPIAQAIHREDKLIPLSLIEQMSELGVFGLTIPETYDGLGLGKVAMCVVTEELSRGYIGVGSLGTRSDIAAELIEGGGTEAQKARWLPRIASGETMTTAVFTEPNHGSDLAHIQSRAERQADGSYRLFGQKTWITHALRADLMTVLARTNPDEKGYAGLSMFLAQKTRTDGQGEEFVDAGLTGTEIPVLGYRGMKEHELSFDGFAVSAEGLLGGEEGQGFKQLMRTFESARIQTAARAVGVAKAALDDALRYAEERSQFGRPIADFPRVGRKLGRMVTRVMAARQLTYHAARQKDSGARCDLEAGMAKLLGTAAAWESADANVQIHGGNGFAEEYLASRLLVDARVLSIFEGANEIQAHVIARRLLE
ncbi:MAG: acyl-CoA dehydrogenase family protein [Myxococcota bacterium]